MTTAPAETDSVRSLVPARMDRLPWTKFHWMVVVGLGVSWILDGLEIQMVAEVGGSVLTDPRAGTGGFSAEQAGLLGTVYLLGQVAGALIFGRMTDRLGRRKLFILTLFIYLMGSGLAGFSWDFYSFVVFRFIAGMGIGGEYTAINSAIDELIPAKYRGRVDIAVNGTYWGGAMIGSLGTFVLFNESLIPIFWGWRIAFFIGPVLGLIIIFLRRHIPESPRWLMTHGKAEEAERTVDEIEEGMRRAGKTIEPVDDSKALEVTPTPYIPYRTVAKTLFVKYPTRSILGAGMLFTQSFLYNAIFFTQALVLSQVYGVAHDKIPVFFLPFAAGNLLGPLLLGPLFDTIGRRKLILGTYGIASVVLALSAALFSTGALTATTQTILWCVCFFFASAGASSAYLTVSEIFPLELRGQAIAFFFACAQVVGAGASAIYGVLVGMSTVEKMVDGEKVQELVSTTPLTVGYFVGAAVMLTGGLIAWFLGVDAERKSLEDIAEPLSKVIPPAARPPGNRPEPT